MRGANGVNLVRLDNLAPQERGDHLDLRELEDQMGRGAALEPLDHRERQDHVEEMENKVKFLKLNLLIMLVMLKIPQLSYSARCPQYIKIL